MLQQRKHTCHPDLEAHALGRVPRVPLVRCARGGRTRRNYRDAYRYLLHKSKATAQAYVTKLADLGGSARWFMELLVGTAIIGSSPY